MPTNGTGNLQSLLEVQVHPLPTRTALTTTTPKEETMTTSVSSQEEEEECHHPAPDDEDPIMCSKIVESYPRDDAHENGYPHHSTAFSIATSNCDDDEAHVSVSLLDSEVAPLDQRQLEHIAQSFQELMMQRKLVQDRTFRFKTYPQCFLGTDAVTVLLDLLQTIVGGDHKDVTRHHALCVGRQVAQTFHWFTHVTGDHVLKDEYLFYNFVPHINLPCQVVPLPRHFLVPIVQANLDIADRQYHLRTYHQCFVGSHAVDAVLALKWACTRADALELLHKILHDEHHTIQHVTGDHELKDDYLFYRFVTPENESQRGMTMKQEDVMEDHHGNPKDHAGSGELAGAKKRVDSEEELGAAVTRKTTTATSEYEYIASTTDMQLQTEAQSIATTTYSTLSPSCNEVDGSTPTNECASSQVEQHSMHAPKQVVSSPLPEETHLTTPATDPTASPKKKLTARERAALRREAVAARLRGESTSTATTATESTSTLCEGSHEPPAPLTRITRLAQRRARQMTETTGDINAKSNNDADSKPPALDEGSHHTFDVTNTAGAQTPALVQPSSSTTRRTTSESMEPQACIIQRTASGSSPRSPLDATTTRRRYPNRFARRFQDHSSGLASNRVSRTRSGPELAGPSQQTQQPRDNLRRSLPPTTMIAAPGDDLVVALATPRGDTVAAATATPRSVITSRARRTAPNSDNKTANPGPDAYANTSSATSTPGVAATTDSNTADVIAAAAAAGLGTADYSQKQRERRLRQESFEDIETTGDANTGDDQDGLPSSMIRPGAYKEIPGRGLIRNDTLRFNLMEQVRQSPRSRRHPDLFTGSCTSPRASIGIHDLNSSMTRALTTGIPSVLVDEDEPRNLDVERNNNSWTAGESTRYLRDPSVSLPNARPIFLLPEDGEEDGAGYNDQQHPKEHGHQERSLRRSDAASIFHVPNPDRSFRAQIPLAGEASRRNIVATAQVTPVALARMESCGSEQSDGFFNNIVVCATPIAMEACNGSSKKSRGLTKAALSKLRKKLGPKGLANLFRKRGKRKTPARSKSNGVAESMIFTLGPPPTTAEVRTSQRRHSF